MSYNVSQLQSLQDLLDSVSGRKIVMPTRHKMMKTLDNEYEKMKNALREIVSKQKYLCLTADVWSSRAQSYLGVTSHFLNSDFKRESFVLAFKQLYGKQTYKELAKAMDEILAEFGIDKSHVTNIVTDGGSNFCKMFKVYGKSIDAVVTTYEEDTVDETSEVDENGEEMLDNANSSSMMDIHGEPFVNEILHFDIPAENDDSMEIEAISENELVYFGAESTPNDVSIDLPPQRRCVSHLLNRLSQVFEQKYLEGIAKTALVQTMGKLHTLWVLVRRSSYEKKTFASQF